MRVGVEKRKFLAYGLCVLATCILLFALLPLLLGRSIGLAKPSETLLAASKGLDAIDIVASLEPAHARLTVRQHLALQNRGDTVRDTVVLRIYPNAFQSADTSPCASEELYDSYYPEGFSAGSLQMNEASVSIGGAEAVAVLYRYADAAKTVLSLPLGGAWPPGEQIEVMLSYTVSIPKTAYRFGVSGGIWALGNCFAIPAVWENGAYRTDEYLLVGDPFVSDCANYTVSLTLPSNYACAGSGYPTIVTSEGRRVYRFNALAVRDFALVVSDHFQIAQGIQAGVLVSAYAGEQKQADELLQYAKRAVACYWERYGAYPYQSFTVVEASFPSGGMSYPAMAMLGTRLLQSGGRALEQAVAHEVAHQWWYAVVGSDQVHQAWQDEALCQFGMLEFIETTYGRAERDELESRTAQSAMRVTMPRGISAGAPLGYFSGQGEYSLVVYDRGAAMLCALDRMMNGKLDGFLQSYYQRYAFKRATRAGFEALLAAQTGEDYAPLITDYLDTAIAN